MIPFLVIAVYFWDFYSPHIFFQSECKVAKFHDYEEKLIVSAWYNKVSWNSANDWVFRTVFNKHFDHEPQKEIWHK